MFKRSNLIAAVFFLSVAFYGCSKDVEILDSKEILTTEIEIEDLTISSNIASNSTSKVHHNSLDRRRRRFLQKSLIPV